MKRRLPHPHGYTPETFPVITDPDVWARINEIVRAALRRRAQSDAST